LDNINLEGLTTTIAEFLVAYSFNIIGALLILVAGFIVARFVSNWVAGLMTDKNVDITLTNFTAATLRLVLLIFVMIIALSNFGVEITPFIAALGGMLFGATFALQGPLSNYAAGITIIVVRPFIVGDTIEIQGQYGIVEEVKLGHTSLRDEDGVRILIPNKHIVGEILHNSKQYRIVESVVGVSYDSDPEAVVELVQSALSDVTDVTSDPKPLVGVEEFGAYAIKIGMRFWVPTESYFETKYAAHGAVHHQLKQAGVNIPFPQRDVHLIQ
jgi:small conductance mechanosensitive channel